MDSSDVLILVASIVLGTLALVGTILGVVFFFVSRLAARGIAAARERYPNARLIVNNASFFGQQSRGLAQIRGNGTLVLTDSELVFEKWVPATHYSIPLKSIQGVETPTSFLGKTRFTPLLKVVFQNEAGQTDAIAWQVADLDGVIRALEDARR